MAPKKELMCGGTQLTMMPKLPILEKDIMILLAIKESKLSHLRRSREVYTAQTQNIQ